MLLLLIISLIVSVAVGSWVAEDAKANQIPISGDNYDLNTGALAWFLSCILLLIATLPYYLYRRAQVLAARRGPEEVAESVSHPSELNIEQRLRSFARLRDDGLITAIDYEDKKRALLGLDTSNSGQAIPDPGRTTPTVSAPSAPAAMALSTSPKSAAPNNAPLGCAVLALFGLGIFIWCVWESSASSGGPVVEAVQPPTKAEWMRRASTVGVGFLLQHGSIHAPRDALYFAVGEPTSTQMMGGTTYLYWKCMDGTIQLSVSTGHLTVNEVSGEVNTY